MHFVGLFFVFRIKAVSEESDEEGRGGGRSLSRMIHRGASYVVLFASYWPYQRIVFRRAVTFTAYGRTEKFQVRKHDRKRKIGRPRRRWGNRITAALKE